MNSRELLREAADELSKLGCGDPMCSSCSCAVYAAALRTLADRLDAEMARYPKIGSPVCAHDLLARLDAPLVESKP